MASGRASMATDAAYLGRAQQELPGDARIQREVARVNTARLAWYVNVLTPGSIRIDDRIRML